MERYSKACSTVASATIAALPRITRLMALASTLEELLQQCPDLDGASAPDIQERL